MSDRPVVLIVDDTSVIVHTLAACIKDEYQIKVATSGERALELAATAPIPDLILLDVMMPSMDGYEVMERLQLNHETRDIPVIFVTGKIDEQDEEKGLAMGAVDYIAKPVRPAIVNARVRTHVTIKRQRDQLASMAMYDQLTGIHNRYFLFDAAAKKIARAKRHSQPLLAMILDIDYFKSINDTLGHDAGDKVLKAVAHVIEDSCRKEDIVARFGGEEFVVLLELSDFSNNREFSSPEKVNSEIRNRAEQIRIAIEELEPDGQRVTVSVGVATLVKEDTFESLLARADKALYYAKENGRNQVKVEDS